MIDNNICIMMKQILNVTFPYLSVFGTPVFDRQLYDDKYPLFNSFLDGIETNINDNDIGVCKALPKDLENNDNDYPLYDPTMKNIGSEV